MFLPPELFRVPGRVREHYERFRAEAARLPDDAFIDWPQYGAYSAGWLSFPLRMTRPPQDLAVDWQRNRRMMSDTVAILEGISGVVQFGLSRLLPGCHIYPHVDDVDPFVYRANLTLAAGADAGMRTGGVIEPYRPHRVLVLDHREMHEAANLGREARTSLLVDFVIDEDERVALAAWRAGREAMAIQEAE